MELNPIAHIHSDFKTKFGIPRQSGIVKEIESKIIFEPQYRNIDAVRGLEDFSHIWLIWGFSANTHESKSMTVRPPKLGGNKRMGVFATRSPYRPNPIGLSSVKINRIEQNSSLGSVIYVFGADLLDGTPIYDIKPYLPFTDCHQDAVGGFAQDCEKLSLNVQIDDRWRDCLSKEEANVLEELLKQDPRPSYQSDAERIYGMRYKKYDVRFSVDNDILFVREILVLND